MVTTVAGVCDILFGMRRCMINLPNRCQRLISRAEWHIVRLKGASGESEGLRRYDKENLLWQSTVAIRSDPVGSCEMNPRTMPARGIAGVFRQD